MDALGLLRESDERLLCLSRMVIGYDPRSPDGLLSRTVELEIEEWRGSVRSVHRVAIRGELPERFLDPGWLTDQSSLRDRVTVRSVKLGQVVSAASLWARLDAVGVRVGAFPVDLAELIDEKLRVSVEGMTGGALDATQVLRYTWPEIDMIQGLAAGIDPMHMVSSEYASTSRFSPEAADSIRHLDALFVESQLASPKSSEQEFLCSGPADIADGNVETFRVVWRAPDFAMLASSW